MNVEIISDPDELALAAAGRIAAAAREAVEKRGRFTLAFSGGRTPWRVFRALAQMELPWNELHLFQVDERVAPDGDPARNMTQMQRSLLDHVAIPPGRVHGMPVLANDLERAAASYAETLEDVCGAERRLDLVHLGLGSDGHTASLVPGDAVLDVTDRDVAITGAAYQGHRRMTLTYPAIDRARSILWIVTGADKFMPLVRLLVGDRTIPAGRVERAAARVLADARAVTSPD